jgi:hypothetical protein
MLPKLHGVFPDPDKLAGGLSASRSSLFLNRDRGSRTGRVCVCVCVVVVVVVHVRLRQAAATSLTLLISTSEQAHRCATHGPLKRRGSLVNRFSRTGGPKAGAVLPSR